MAQFQKFHYASKGSFNLSQHFYGIIPSGYYAGFDFEPDATMVMKFKEDHPDSGIEIVNQDLSKTRYGLVITKQGLSVYESSPVPTIQIESNLGPTDRYDAIVLQHQFQEIPGGVPAQYVVVPIDLGAVPDPYDFDALSNWLSNAQTVIGVLKLPSGTVALNGVGVTFTKAPVPTFAKAVVDLSGKADLEGGKLKDSQIPAKLLNIPVPNIAARDALTGLQAGQRVWVSDATGDPSVSSGSAGYIWTGSAWDKQFEAESFDVDLSHKADLDGSGNVLLSQLKNVPGLFQAIAPIGIEVTFNIDLSVGVSPPFNPANGQGSGIWAGWAICDGRNGTRDKRGRVNVGQSNDKLAGGNTEANLADYLAIGAIGGYRSITLTPGQMPEHTHDYGDIFFSEFGGTVIVPGNRGTSAGQDTDNTGYQMTRTSAPAGGNQAHENRQPWMVVFLVQKMSNV